ncbi:unnamed protein product, partial [Ectocarpus sp. 12 AP-2014]
MSKTQERLATGLKVNSALDNPTNFFTASALNSRASDLGRLLDGVSNATQTLEAADNGISAITKLVESAQATARQALQTPSTIDVVGAATPGVSSAGAFSAVDISTGVSAADAGTLSGTGFSAVDLSGVTPGSVTQFTGGGGTVTNQADVTDTELANIINQELTDAGLGVTASVDTGTIRLTTDTNGGTLTIGAVGGTQAANSGLNDASFAGQNNT